MVSLQGCLGTYEVRISKIRVQGSGTHHKDHKDYGVVGSRFWGAGFIEDPWNTLKRHFLGV